MNKNSKARRREALKNYRKGQPSTDFSVPVMRSGGYVLSKVSIGIGTRPPNERVRRSQPPSKKDSVHEREATETLAMLVQEADDLRRRQRGVENGHRKIKPPPVDE